MEGVTVLETVCQEGQFSTGTKGLDEEGSSSCDATVGTEEEEDGTTIQETADRCSDGSDSGLGPDEEGRTTSEVAPGEGSSTDSAISTSEELTNEEETHIPGPLPAPSSSPKRSSLKRLREASLEESNQEDLGAPLTKKKRSITFDTVTVYYFPRTQGFTCVPSQGGSTLGMAPQHTHVQSFTLGEHALEQRRHHRHMLMQLRSQRLAAQQAESLAGGASPSSSSEESDSEEEASEPSDNELDPDNYYFLQPVPTRQRRVLLRAAGVRKIDSVEKDECRDIRSSREFCGCACKGYCDPDTCSCARAGIKCQVDRLSFPCGCSRDGCANGAGRIEFNPVRVRTHFIHTLMRLELEKKQAAEQLRHHHMAGGSGEWSNELPSASRLLTKHHEPSKPEPHHVNLSPNMESCVHAGNFTTMHYGETQPQQSLPAREDSLDLYSFREDSFSAEDTSSETDGKVALQRQPHRSYCNFTPSIFHNAGFSQQTSDYNAIYRFQEHANSSYHQQASHQSFNTFPATNFGPMQYDYTNFNKSGGDNGLTEIEFCDPNQVANYPDAQMGSVLFGQTGDTLEATVDPLGNIETPNAPTSGGQSSKYTSLHPVSNNTKLEPFSELLSAQYSAPFSAPQAMFQPTGSYQEHDEPSHSQDDHAPANLRLANTNSAIVEECAGDNFGEIIKKSMVETVSA